MQLIKQELREDGILYTLGIPENVCSQIMEIFTKDGIILKVQIHGGCAGNTQGVSALCAGAKIESVISRLKNIDCGGRGSSCPDQLAQLFETIK